MNSLFKSKKSMWNTAFYQENLTSPFKFEYVSSNSNELTHITTEWDTSTKTVMIKTFSNIEFVPKSRVYIDNIQYIIDSVAPSDLEEYLNSPLFKSNHNGKILTLTH